MHYLSPRSLPITKPHRRPRRPKNRGRYVPGTQPLPIRKMTTDEPTAGTETRTKPKRSKERRMGYKPIQLTLPSVPGGRDERRFDVVHDGTVYERSEKGQRTKLKEDTDERRQLGDRARAKALRMMRGELN